jgi:predicted metal-dependent hydrolase
MKKKEFLFLILLLLMAVVISAFVIKNKYEPPEIIKKLKRKLALVEPSFADLDIREDHTGSYTLNKSAIYICTRDPKTGKYYSEDILLYVCLHECTHAIMADYDENHTEKFVKLFNKLLKKAEEVGIYNKHIKIPHDYCGLEQK